MPRGYDTRGWRPVQDPLRGRFQVPSSELKGSLLKVLKYYLNMIESVSPAQLVVV